MPEPPFRWVDQDVWPEVVITLDLHRFLTPHMSAYVKWYTAPSDSRTMHALGRVWKYYGLEIPGGKLWNRVRPLNPSKIRDIRTEKELSQREADQILLDNGEYRA